MRRLNDEKGITLISLTVTIIVLMILAISVNMSMTATTELKKYNAIKEDIIELSEEVKTYYLKNEQLPVYKEKLINISSYGIPNNDINPNDNENYYPIDISVFSKKLDLNCGDGNKNKNFTTKDLYVMNEQSLTIYYLQGAILNGQRHYTIVDDFSGGSFAEDYYKKVNLPIISVVTMESNGKDKTLATIGDTVKLKILSNYIFSEEEKPTIVIEGKDVTSQCTWNGKIGTVEYLVESITDDEGNSKSGQTIDFVISDYQADSRSGEEISEVTFGTKVAYYPIRLIDAYNKGIIKIGDYMKYTPNTANSYTSVTNENGWDNQTYTADATTQWRVLGVKGDNVLLISADPIKKVMDESSTNAWDKDPYLYMKGAYSYVNCKKILNDICNIYSTDLGKARSITIEDINNVLGVKVESDKVYFKSDSTKTNIDLSTTNIWLGLGKTYTYKPTDYSAESYINGKKNVTKIETVTQNGYWYSCDNLLSNTIGNTTIGDLLFKGAVLNSMGKSYWLASPATDVYSEGVNFGPGLANSNIIMTDYGLFYSHGDWSAGSLAVRPIMTLDSNVTIEQVPLTSENTQTWTWPVNNAFIIEGGHADTGEAGPNLGSPVE